MNMLNAPGRALDTSMSASVVEYDTTENCGPTGQTGNWISPIGIEAYAVNGIDHWDNHHSMAQREGVEGDKTIAGIYQPVDVQAIAKARYKLSNLRMGLDQNPTIFFNQLVTLEHTYAHTKQRNTMTT
jgi:hypothetical protein